jgi:NAD(P)-dependent dehydrogenase (short-subunit alcohol dehydrogenase family)
LPRYHKVSCTLLGRRGSAEEIAAAVCFSSGLRARYITAQTLHVNGGVYLGESGLRATQLPVEPHAASPT